MITAERASWFGTIERGGRETVRGDEMIINYRVKHKTFISFYHHDDQDYKEYIDKRLSTNIINKSVDDGEYDPDDSDEYVKRLIREEKVSDSSVVVVLVGPNTYKRKHVDWEIYAGLRESVNGRSGLVGIILPKFDRKYGTLPARLEDNVESGYAKLYSWDYAISHFDAIVKEAFDNRIRLVDKADNTRLQMRRNKS